ncbi:Lipase 3 [Camponotus floridanus]|uniref:Lipase 3 n=1 Tax=Camponotus floridanus TaxID=104421 RepID=E2AU10_CAMFO|nr:Lipase 3 [Camponotus floridanus]
MRFIALVYFLTFYGLVDAAPAAMAAKLNMWREFMEGITWINSWNQARNNPDVILDTLEMIRKAGYPAEAHVVTTEDGYRLTLHRIPGANDSLPVLLQHGLLCSSVDWIFLGKGKALASMKWASMIYPRMFTYITNITSQSLHTYIGHSMGTASFYIMASERPEFARMVQKMISFAPAVFISHMKSPLKYFSKTFPLELYKLIMRHFFHNEFLPQNNFWKYLAKYGCEQNIIEEKICANLIFIICGYDREELNYTLLPIILSHDPAGASTKTILHYIQIYQTGKFRKYDYGLDKNLLVYNSSEPPDYNLANITVPIALFYGLGDWLVDSVVSNKAIQIKYVAKINSR